MTGLRRIAQAIEAVPIAYRIGVALPLFWSLLVIGATTS